MVMASVGSGILHPKLINFFRVQFDSPKETQDLSLQLISISSIRQSTETFGTFHVEFEDDLGGLMMKQLQDLYKDQALFKMSIDYLDGDEKVTGTLGIHNVRLTEIAHGALDYAGPNHGYMMQLNVPRVRTGAIIDKIAESEVGAAIMSTFGGTSLTFHDDKNRAYGQVIVTATFSYQFVTYTT